MDPLSDVLTLLKPQSYLSACLNAGGTWAMRSENHVGAIKCYAIVDGACWLAVDGIAEPTRLGAGDCFVLPSGRSFTLGSELSIDPTPAADILGKAEPGSTVVHNGGGGVLLVGTRFQVDRRRAEMLVAALPPFVLLQTAEDKAALRWLIERMMTELEGRGAGAALAAHYLAHLMLLQAFRQHLAQQAGTSVGWFYALTDPQVSLAIRALHEDPAHRWTLGELARIAGLSRSAFARRFRERVGDTPIAYLTRWRMLLATERLSASRDTLAQIATTLGYESENAFNTAFKRVMGCSPRRYVSVGTSQVGPSPSRRPLTL